MLLLLVLQRQQQPKQNRRLHWLPNGSADRLLGMPSTRRHADRWAGPICGLDLPPTRPYQIGGYGSASASSSAFGSTRGVPYPWLRQQGSFAQALALMPLSDSSQGSGSSASQVSTRESHMSAGDSVPEEAGPDRRWTSVRMISDDASTPPARLGQPGSTLSSPSR